MKMKNMMKKLRSRTGESLIESLVAILILTLASIVMYTMVTSAADINRTAQEADRAMQEQLVIVERADDDDRSGEDEITMTMTVNKSGGGTQTKIVGTISVNVYGGEDGTLYSYFAK